jgi:hypothetical protein
LRTVAAFVGPLPLVDACDVSVQCLLLIECLIIDIALVTFDCQVLAAADVPVQRLHQRKWFAAQTAKVMLLLSVVHQVHMSLQLVGADKTLLTNHAFKAGSHVAMHTFCVHVDVCYRPEGILADVAAERSLSLVNAADVGAQSLPVA